MPWITIIAPESYVNETFDSFLEKWVPHYCIKFKSKSEAKYWKMPEYTYGELYFEISPMSLEEWKAFFKNVLGFEVTHKFGQDGGDIDLGHYVPGGTPLTNDNPWLSLALYKKDILQN